MRKLKTFVHVVERDEDGTQINAAMFGPGDAVPSWAEKAITNPDVWADEDPGEVADQVDDSSDRPRGNASRDAWADYARSRGVDVSDDMDRAAIIAAVDKK